MELVGFMFLIQFHATMANLNKISNRTDSEKFDKDPKMRLVPKLS